MKPLALMLGLAVAAPFSAPGDVPEQYTECVFRMRKVAEAAQAYRRTHQGAWPESLSQLRAAGLLRTTDDCCPLIARELAAQFPDYLVGSQGENRASTATYQYELAELERRREQKFSMLQRPFWEQVPILRCQRHSREQMLNLTANGTVYLSSTHWETLFVDDVPFTYRHPYLAINRPAPPFSAGLPPRSPRLPSASIDLTPWCNSYPADPWWWGKPTFSNQQPVPTLAALRDEQDDGAISLSGMLFDVRCIVQTEGRFMENSDGKAQRAFALQAFPTSRKNLRLDRTVERAYFLLGTVWEEQKGRPVGSLMWHYEDESSAVRQIRYGMDTECFQNKSPALTPQWSAPAGSVSTHLWILEWENPHPKLRVVSVDFTADSTSFASPFIAALSICP